MKRDFLLNLKVGDQPLSKEVIDAIMAENGRDIERAKANAGANGGSDGKMFTQEDVNRIVSDRLARERDMLVDDRENDLKAREARLDCRDYLDSKKYPAKLLDLLDHSDVEKFKTAADAMVEGFPSIVQQDSSMPPPFSATAGTVGSGSFESDAIANAFKPKV